MLRPLRSCNGGSESCHRFAVADLRFGGRDGIRNDRYAQGFRVPSGVRKSRMQEAAGRS